MRTMMGERANMEGTKAVHIRMRDQEMMQEVWLAPIQDPCIIGQDLLAHWGARIDVGAKVAHHAPTTVVFSRDLGGLNDAVGSPGTCGILTW
ncbi:hypothetical protein NHX12_018616 [Muraenolepis orangiensis]|uniref:Uncharacterized protein n=1 Tax=Muraenolepis orangiensis TaxID=630683 RepID=A0A9Q0F027_9TELE|nr:hypothetical protein NHX12_018616 [Muraenolepis orangiensis]